MERTTRRAKVRATGRTTGRDIAAHLRSTRIAVDVAWIHAIDTPTRPDSGLVDAVGQARDRLASARRRLSALADQMGLEPLAVGPLDKPEDNPPIGGGPRRKGRSAQS